MNLTRFVACLLHRFTCVLAQLTACKSMVIDGSLTCASCTFTSLPIRVDISKILKYIHTYLGSDLRFKTGVALAAAADQFISRDGWTNIDMACGLFEYAKNMPLLYGDGVQMLAQQYAELWMGGQTFHDVASAEFYTPSSGGAPVRKISHPMTADWAIATQRAIHDDPQIRAQR